MTDSDLLAAKQSGQARRRHREDTRCEMNGPESRATQWSIDWVDSMTSAQCSGVVVAGLVVYGLVMLTSEMPVRDESNADAD